MPACPDYDSDDLIRLVDRWQRRKIVVVGDFMLDRYVYGNADRLSPDAPVPVLKILRDESQPGGGANVCRFLSALRCDVAAIGIVGNDASARVLRRALKKDKIDLSGLIASTDRPTTVKHNYIGLAQHRHPQKMFRADQEDSSPISAQMSRRLLHHARQHLKNAAVLCLEDYGKGVLTEELCRSLIDLARRLKVPVLVDPAAVRRYDKYAHATCLTPNRFEAALACGYGGAVSDEGAWADLGRKLMRTLGLETVVMTLDRHGLILVERRRRARRVSTRTRSVYDVTGAGDIVLAMIAAAIANGADWPAAVQLANVAAGLEVEKFGAVPIELDRVLLELLKQRHEQLGKLRSIEQLLPELAAHRAQGRKVVFTNGCFDILHAGHVSYLRRAQREGDLLVVAINSDASIRRIKGEGRPVNRETDRIMVLSELESVDYVVMFDQDTPINLIRKVKPQVLVKGNDYRRRDVVGGDWVEKHGGCVVLVPLVKGRSTTNIIRKIARQ